MQTETPLPKTLPDGTHVLEVYRYAARKGSIEVMDVAALELGIGVGELSAAVAYLVGSRLLRPDVPDTRLVPVDPDTAAAALVSNVEREIYRRRAEIDQIRARIDAFRPDYPSPCEPGASLAMDYLDGPMEVSGFLTLASDACREEILVLLSGDDDAAELDVLTSAHLPLLGGRVDVRIICRHRNRTDLATRVKMTKLIDAGASVRTVSYVPRAAAVFDRTQAVLFGLDAPANGAARVANPGVVRFLLDLFEHIWDGATPLEGTDPGYTTVADDLQRTIAALMAEGHTDEAIARKLDMSVRTCRRHIAALLRDLDAISRFQAGVLAARRYFAREAG